MGRRKRRVIGFANQQCDRATRHHRQIIRHRHIAEIHVARVRDRKAERHRITCTQHTVAIVSDTRHRLDHRDLRHRVRRNRRHRRIIARITIRRRRTRHTRRFFALRIGHIRPIRVGPSVRRIRHGDRITIEIQQWIPIRIHRLARG